MQPQHVHLTGPNVAPGGEFYFQTGPGEYVLLQQHPSTPIGVQTAKHRNRTLRGHRRGLAGKPSYRQRQASAKAAQHRRATRRPSGMVSSYRPS